MFQLCPLLFVICLSGWWATCKNFCLGQGQVYTSTSTASWTAEMLVPCFGMGIWGWIHLRVQSLICLDPVHRMSPRRKRSCHSCFRKLCSWKRSFFLRLFRKDVAIQWGVPNLEIGKNVWQKNWLPCRPVLLFIPSTKWAVFLGQNVWCCCLLTAVFCNGCCCHEWRIYHRGEGLQSYQVVVSLTGLVQG